ncbi:MAG: Crp/Fnr family transcriptional regulator [Chloroflexota bacterium]
MVELASVSIFQELDEQALQTIQAAAHHIHFERHEILFYQYDPAVRLYVLLSGRVRLFKSSRDGKQTSTRIVGASEVIGISAAMPNTISPLTAQAMEPCDTLAWDQTTFVTFTQLHPFIMGNILRTVSERFADLQQQYLELATERVEQRIAHTLLRLANQFGQFDDRHLHISLSLTHRDIAELSGTTHYTVSRTLHDWQEKGIVDIQHKKVIMFDPVYLSEIAEDPHTP